MSLSKQLKRLIKTSLIKVSPIGFYTQVKKYYVPPQSIIHKITFKGAFPIDIFGQAKAKLYNSTFTIETILFWQGFSESDWELTSRKVWAELVKTQDVILDIGANSGVFSIIAKALNPKSRVIAFEPQPNIYEALKKNIEVNSFQIEAENYALSNQTGILPFYNYGENTFIDGNTTAGSLNKDWFSEDQASINVDVKLLKDVLIQKNISKVDLIKIDVETFEIEVLEGYGEAMYQHRPILLIEVQNNTIAERLSKMFEGRKYVFYKINEGQGLQKKSIIKPSGTHDYVNYVLIPQEKDSLVSSFLVA